MFVKTKQLMLVGLLAAVPSTVFAQAATPSEDTPAPAGSGTMQDTQNAAPEAAPSEQPAPDATMPAETMPAENAPDAALPSAGMPDATMPDTTSSDGMAPEAETTEAEAPAKPVEGQIVMQSENTILAKDLIGRRVYSGADETVGDINDLIVNLDGSVEGVVIGVGGFLGMGEKKVAVEMSAITVSAEPQTGNIRLVLSSTREDLEAAPEFRTAEEQQEPMDNAVAPAAPQ
jgi:sporulation protein YlmC with PRC-barrel domain